MEGIEAFADRKILRTIKKNSVIAYDLSDILKDSAKKIENIGKVFDGSKRQKGNGFFVHGVGVGGLIWRLRLHDGNKNFLPQIRKEILEKIIALTKKFDPILALDRGNDDGKLFEYLLEKSVKFIIRLNKNRNIIIEETGEVLSIEVLKPGRYKILIPSDDTKQRKKPEYKKYILIVWKNKKFKTPMRLLCSSDMNAFSSSEIIGFYLERWGLENSFKHVKQGLDLERIRVLKFKKFQNLVSLMHLCTLLSDFLLKKLKDNMKNFLHDSLNQLFIAYQKFKKNYCRTTNPHSFLVFLRTIFPEFCVHRKFPKPKSQTSLLYLLNQKLKLS